MRKNQIYTEIEEDNIMYDKKKNSKFQDNFQFGILIAFLAFFGMVFYSTAHAEECFHYGYGDHEIIIHIKNPSLDASWTCYCCGVHNWSSIKPYRCNVCGTPIGEDCND